MKIVAAGKNAPWELYDLKTDRCEENDLAAQQPDLVQKLAAQWEQHKAEFHEIATRDLKK